MLKRWSLEGFKSFGSATDLTISPLTIFAGANSSGKSSLIQSILLLKQTVQYGSPNRALTLNGPLIRLGTPDDVIHFKSNPKRLSISFTFSAPPLDVTNELSPWMRSLRRSTYRSDKTTDSVSGSFTWGPVATGTAGASSPTQDETTLEVGRLTVSERALSSSDGPSESFISYRPFMYRRDDLPEDLALRLLHVEVDSLSEAELFEDKPEATLLAVTTEYFLPGQVLIDFNGARRRAAMIARAVVSPNTLLSQSVLSNERLSPAVTYIIEKWLETHIQDQRLPIERTSLIEAVRGLTQQAFRFGRRNPEFDEQLAVLRKQLETQLIAELPSARDRVFETPRLLNSAADFVRLYLQHGVRYLGPLRDPPKPVYQLEALENTTDVGYRGEHTAAVLFLNGDTEVDLVTPQSLASGRITRARLRYAVSAWLQYLGVATDVVATDAGVFGNQLRVTAEGLSKQHDLTNVGVGVSQVLPIVVSALLASTTSLLIFEQPELHLHPKVQMLLADFFYSIALSGKQCILESHSEYMVERFRRRIAEEEDDRLRKMLSIYFTERINGETRCRSVEVNRFGAVVDWPKDFFDQSQVQSREILEAAAAKRRREKSK